MYAGRERRVRMLIAMLSVASVFGFSFQTLMPVFVRGTLGRGAEAYGWALSAAGSGALIGALWLAIYGGRARKGLMVIVAAAVFGSSLFLLAFVRYFPAVLGLLVVIGLSSMIQTATTNTLVQTIAPDALRGRVISIYTLSFVGLAPFGALLAGIVAERFGPAPYFAVGGMLCATTALIALRASPRLRATA